MTFSSIPWFALGLVLVAAPGCSAEDALIVNPDGRTPASTATGRRVPFVVPAPLYQSPDRFFCISGVCEPGIATDLAFNPARSGELWVVLRQTYNGEPCEAAGGSQTGCEALRSKVVVIAGASTDNPVAVAEDDGNSWHFMRLATAIAFAKDDTFATVGEARTGNFTNDAADYMGPTLWSSDPNIFAHDFVDADGIPLNGSHLDMLHATPFGMGIAHERNHVFWAFNGQVGAIDRYDFHAGHEPGGDDHSDGEMSRYVTGEVSRVENVPSHMAFAPDARTLLIADTGNGRVVALDTQSGARAAELKVDDDQIEDPFRVDGAQLTQIVPPGRLKRPSGLAIRGDFFVVCDAATSILYQFSLDGVLIDQLATGLPPDSLAGLEFGPDQRLYVAQRQPAAVLRLDWPAAD